MATGRLVVHTSNRLEVLFEALAQRLQLDPLPPLQAETILVPAAGMARWLELAFARRHGIAAGLDLQYPGAFLQHWCREPDGDGDRYAPEVLTCRLFRLLGERRLQAQLGPAALYCSDDADGRKRWQLAQRLGRCFDDYQLYRDDLLAAFEAGDRRPPAGEHAGWQRELWLQLRAEDPAGAPSPRRLRRLADRLAQGRAGARPLPPRLAVFGASTLAPGFVQALEGFAAHLDVHLYVPTPTAEYFGDHRRRRGGDDDGADADEGDGSRLLAQYGAEAREFADLLLDRDSVGCTLQPLPFPEPGTDTLLHVLQHDILHVCQHGRGELPQFPLTAADRSLTVHSCHSPLRELQVIRDQLLAAFAADPQLQPHEVMVLVPDIDTYAPLVQMVFGALQDQLPFHLADRQPATELPLVATFLQLLAAAPGRATAPELLGLLEEPSLLRRFGLLPADLPVLRSWCDRAAIRWGVDTAHQQALDLPACADTTFRRGLDRLLLGTATGPVDGLVHGLLPVAFATEAQQEVLQAFHHCLDQLFQHFAALRTQQPAAVAAQRLRALLAGMFEPESAEERRGADAVQQAITALEEHARLADLVEPLAPSVLRLQLQEALGKGRGANGFLGGAITIAALQPLRAVPVRLLAIAGLDDLSFPRRHRPDAFDLVAQQRRRGDRSPRDDDRQLFLDALLSARQQLVLTYTGRSQKDDAPCAPSVVLDELLDWVDVAAAPATGRARSAVLHLHPLQVWSPRYRDGRDPRLFTYEPDLPELPTPRPEPPFVSGPVRAPALGPVVQLADLQAFWSNPAREYLRRTLGVELPEADLPAADSEPFLLPALVRYGLLQGELERHLRGDPPSPDATECARQQGSLPPGRLGEQLHHDVEAAAAALCARLPATGLRPSEGLSVPVGDRVVHGRIALLGAGAAWLPRAGKLKEKDRLRGFVQHVFACAAAAAGAEVPTVTHVPGTDATSTFAPLPGAEAMALLDQLVQGMAAGLAMPLPFFPQASAEFTRGSAGDGPDAARRRAAAAFHRRADDDIDGNQHGGAGDLQDRWVALCWRGRDPLELPEFAHWATVVWSALRAAEVLEDVDDAAKHPPAPGHGATKPATKGASRRRRDA